MNLGSFGFGSGGGTPSGMISGGGSAPKIPKFTAASVIGDSQMSDNGTTVFIGASATSASAVFEVNSTTQGVLFPRVTTAQRNAIPVGATANSLFIFNTTISQYQYYDHTTTSWKTIDNGLDGIYSGSGTVPAGTTATITDYIAFNGGEFRTENGYWQGTAKILYINPNATTDNLFVGENAGNATMTGVNNIGVGINSLNNNTVGTSNLAFGRQSLLNNTNGNQNTAVGHNTLEANVSGYYNVAVGQSTLSANLTGIDNVAIGWSAMVISTQASNNVAIGYRAMSLSTTAYYAGNVAIGSNTLLNTSTSNQVAVGYNALTANTTGIGNVAVGYAALFSNTTGANNTAQGYECLYNNIIGVQQSAFGFQALYSNTAYNNTVFGFQSLYSNITGYANVAIGYQSGYYETGSNKLFIDNQARIDEADGRAKALIYGVFDASVANQKLYINANEGKFGQINIYSDTSLNNFHWNSSTMPSIPSGSRNTLIGNNDTGTLGLTTGANNFLGGAFAGVNLTTGARNILIGTYSIPNLIDGNDNIFLGNSNTTLTSVAQSLAFNGEVRANNQVVFGDPDRARYSSFYFGQGIDTPDSYGKFDVNFFATSNQAGETDKTATVTNFIINGSQGTGTGTGGAIVFKTAPAGATGSTPNALVSAMIIKPSGVINMPVIPTSSVGLVSGDVWNNGGILTIV